MNTATALANIVLGLVYTSYGFITIADLHRGWRTRGELHFGLAWITMAFTCGPHHLEHGLHLLAGQAPAAPLDLIAVLVGAPAGVIWFSLRVEAVRGGAGDRFIPGSPAWIRAIPYAFAGYVVAMTAAAAALLWTSFRLDPNFAPNLWLWGLYMVIGFYLARTQLRTRAETGGWSLSGVSLTIVFPTCALMHAAYVLYVSAGAYELHWHLLVIDWLGVPAALYFVWVVRKLHRGQLRQVPSPALPSQRALV